ncbi:MAG: hypothetical protein RL660_518 [Bacteroidota bacterium]
MTYSVRIFRFASLLVLALIWNTSVCLAQVADEDDEDDDPPAKKEWPMKCDNPQIEAKAKELVEIYKKQGYSIFNGGFLTLEHRTMCPIMLHLKAKTIYHFIVVGQPDLNYLEVGLGHEAFGTDEVRDRIRKHRDHTYFTHFAYVAPFEGNYLLSVTSDVRGKKSFTTAVYVMIKRNAVTINE